MLEIIGVSQLNYSVQYIHIRDKKILRAWPFRPPFSAFRQGGRGQGAGGIIIYHQAEDESVCTYVLLCIVHTMYIHYIQLLLQVHFSSVKQLNSFDRHTYLIYNFISEAARDQVIPNSQQGFVGSCQGRGRF